MNRHTLEGGRLEVGCVCQFRHERQAQAVTSYNPPKAGFVVFTANLSKTTVYCGLSQEITQQVVYLKIVDKKPDNRKRKVKLQQTKAAKDHGGNKKHREDFEWLLKSAVGGRN